MTGTSQMWVGGMLSASCLEPDRCALDSEFAPLARAVALGIYFVTSEKGT